MVTFESEDFQKQLHDIAKRFREKLEKGTEDFIYRTADILIQSTPYGDDKVYQSLYLKREKETGLAPFAGFSKGSWIMSFGAPALVGAIVPDNKSGGKSQARNHAIAHEFQLGDIVYITNSVPYIEKLEKGSSQQAPEGIMEMSLGKLERLYGLNVARILTGGKR
jgi:hypothetical protein